MNTLNSDNQRDSLEVLRKNIDGIDLEILELLKKRFEQVLFVGEYKLKHNLPPLQPERWENVLNEKIQKGGKMGLDKEMIENIWNSIHDGALKLEHTVTDELLEEN